jgi:hypothetical protein
MGARSATTRAWQQPSRLAEHGDARACSSSGGPTMTDPVPRRPIRSWIASRPYHLAPWIALLALVPFACPRRGPAGDKAAGAHPPRRRSTIRPASRKTAPCRRTTSTRPSPSAAAPPPIRTASPVLAGATSCGAPAARSASTACPRWPAASPSTPCWPSSRPSAPSSRCTACSPMSGRSRNSCRRCRASSRQRGQHHRRADAAPGQPGTGQAGRGLRAQPAAVDLERQRQHEGALRRIERRL